jgi:hypothetical protein
VAFDIWKSDIHGVMLADASMDAGKGETPKTTTQDARSADARNGPGNRKPERESCSLQQPRHRTQTTEKNPISKTHPVKPTPPKMRQTRTKQLKITNNQADHLVFGMRHARTTIAPPLFALANARKQNT